MAFSSQNIAWIKALEAKTPPLKAYPERRGDGSTIWSIGYGSTRIFGQAVYQGQTATLAQVEAQFVLDLGASLKIVNTLGKFNENQQIALTSYFYNRGPGAPRGIVQRIKEVGAEKAFTEYWGSNQYYKTALIERRRKEAAKFNEPVGVAESVSISVIIVIIVAILLTYISKTNNQNKSDYEE